MEDIRNNFESEEMDIEMESDEQQENIENENDESKKKEIVLKRMKKNLRI